MTNRLRKSERPTTTWLGGMLCRPRAFRVNDSTMTMRVKLVIIMSRAGAIEIRVRAMMIVTLSDGLSSVLPRLMDTEPGAAGAGGAEGAAGGAGRAGVAGVAGVPVVDDALGVGAGAAAAGFIPRKSEMAAMANTTKTPD